MNSAPKLFKCLYLCPVDFKKFTKTFSPLKLDNFLQKTCYVEHNIFMIRNYSKSAIGDLNFL